VAQALPCTPTMLTTDRHCSHSFSHCYPWRQCRLVVLAWAHDHHASHHSNRPSTGCHMHGQSLVLVHVMASWAYAHLARSPKEGAGGRWCWSWVVVGGLVHPLDMRHAPSAIIACTPHRAPPAKATATPSAAGLTPGPAHPWLVQHAATGQPYLLQSRTWWQGDLTAQRCTHGMHASH
jgi:hypothetical protein